MGHTYCAFRPPATVLMCVSSLLLRGRQKVFLALVALVTFINKPLKSLTRDDDILQCYHVPSSSGSDYTDDSQASLRGRQPRCSERREPKLKGSSSLPPARLSPSLPASSYTSALPKWTVQSLRLALANTDIPFKNLAFKGTATQSSTWDNWAVQHAIDGVRNAGDPYDVIFCSGSCVKHL
ncbi:hypothetical protein E1301_Tti013646 [Triplophysa tibetana]|uniref:Uncharacterized protein n=1 Tax=Triplophysa tibetana TaxID=1572043 RepID=A0A5A9PPN5_9TELE|nr:hypothetical protein E1301_Tti013646 [Triplophysa tibetana]